MTDTEKLIADVSAAGDAIGAAYRAGDASAKSVVNAYKMVYACPADPCALTLLDIAFADWQKSALASGGDA